MATTAKDIFVTGLRNAHAMEIQARELMERQSERLTDYPEVHQRVTQHLKEPNEQLKRWEPCLSACGESTSTLKDTSPVSSRKCYGCRAFDGWRRNPQEY